MVDIFNENLFLIVLALVWIVGAILQDFKRREIDNLWNFSLIFIALAYRAFFSVYGGNGWFFLNGLIGLGIFFVLHNLFYYARLFAGGDAKLLFALGAILPLSYDWIVNLKIFGVFILLFFILGSVYSLIYSFVLVIGNWGKFVKEFVKEFKKYKGMFLISFVFVVLWSVLVFLISQVSFALIGLVVLLFPVLFVYAKAVEESCMVRLVRADKVTLGDWLYKNVLVKGKKIKPSWDGVSKRQLGLIKKRGRKVLVKYGIPFSPSFLFGFLGLLWLIRRGWF